MAWQTIVEYDANDTLDILVENGTPVRVCMTDTEESPALNRHEAAREIYLATGYLVEIGEWQPAEGDKVVAVLTLATNGLNPVIVEAVKGKANEAAENFWTEFEDTLDPAKTDWDSVAWGEDRSVVERIDEDADPDDYAEIYLNVLEWEVLRAWRTAEQLRTILISQSVK